MILMKHREYLEKKNSEIQALRKAQSEKSREVQQVISLIPVHSHPIPTAVSTAEDQSDEDRHSAEQERKGSRSHYRETQGHRG